MTTIWCKLCDWEATRYFERDGIPVPLCGAHAEGYELGGGEGLEAIEDLPEEKINLIDACYMVE